MFQCHQDERTFWRTMNPARLHALFDAYLAPPKSNAKLRTALQPEERSLAAFLMGG